MREYKVEELSTPRPDKNLLVLDIDYTIFGTVFYVSLCFTLLGLGKRPVVRLH